MVFSKGFRVVLLAAFCVFASVAADLNEEKQKAIKNLDTQKNDVSKLYEETLADAKNQEEKTEKVIDYIKNYGEKVTLENKSNTYRLHSAYEMKGDIKGCSERFFKCIDGSHTLALKEICEYYENKFLELIDSIEEEADNERRKLIENWREEYHEAFNKYSTTHANLIKAIQTATNKDTISSAVKNFEKATAEITAMINSIIPKINKMHVQLLKTVNEAGDTVTKYVENRVETYIAHLNACFDKCH